ncbi:MAG: LAGLIDADG family homing endonuclease [Nanoarchaeota archaeon]
MIKYLDVYYTTKSYNGGWKEHSLYVPRFIYNDKRTFEVFGLLQAEMGKTNNGCISFANHEFKIINYILNWFEKELELNKNEWKWSIKLNIQEPTELNYKNEIEQKVTNHWTTKTKIKLEHSYPKKVTYIKNTSNTKVKFYDKGTLVLEYKNNLYSQIIKNIIRKITYEKIQDFDNLLVQSYIRGIIAGDGCVEHNKDSGHSRVFITSCNEDEREIYSKCLSKLNINSNLYDGHKEVVISRRENNVQLLKQRLMTLSPEKYAKFLSMIKQYPHISEETGYFKQKGINSWNRIPKEKINQVIELYNSGMTSTKEISMSLNLHILKVQRVFRENNLGKRIYRYPESMRKEIVLHKKLNPHLNSDQIANKFNVHKSAVIRAIRKYGKEEILNEEIQGKN